MSRWAAAFSVVVTPVAALLVCAPVHLTRFSPPKLWVAFLGVLFGWLALGSPRCNCRDDFGVARWGWWALVLWGALSFTWSPDPDRGVGLWLLWLLAGLWALLVLRVLRQAGPLAADLRRWLAWAWGGAGAVVGVLTLVQRGGLLRMGLHRVTATVGNPNRVAAVLVLMLPLAVLLGAKERTRSGRWVARGLALLLVLAIVATGCRAALVAVVVQGLFWCFTAPGELRGKAAGVAALVLAVGVAWSPDARLAKDGRAASGRAYIARVSSSVMVERPARGAGLGGFPARAAVAQGKLLEQHPELRGRWSHLDDAHNQWIMVGAQLGVVGLLALLLLLLPGLWRLVARRREPWSRHGLAAWLGLGVCAVTETVLLSPVVVLLAFGWLALGRAPVASTPAGPGWRAPARFAVILVLAVCGAALATVHLLAHYHLGQGLRRLRSTPARRGELVAATRHYDRGLAGGGAASELRFQRALARRALGDLQGALLDMRRAYALRPAPDRALVLGDLGLVMGDTKAAVRWYRRALRLHPRYQRAYNNLGVALLRAGRRRRACGVLLRARSLRPGDPTTRRNLRTYCTRRAQAAR